MSVATRRADERLPEARGRQTLCAVRDSHVREHQRLFRRVTLDLGMTESASLPTDQRPVKFLEGSIRISPPLLPIWPISLDRFFEAGHPASELSGHLERLDDTPLGN